MRRTKTDIAFMNARAMMLGFIICALAFSVVLIAPIRSYAGEQTQNTAVRIESTGEEFDTLQAAIDAATDGDTITVLRDLNETSTISGKELTIDLDGKSISGKDSNGDDICGGKSLLTVTDGSDVTIRNGVLRDGKGTYKYDEGKRTHGAGAVYTYDSHVSVISVDFIDNKETSSSSLTGSAIYVNASSLSVDDCSFDNSNPEAYVDTRHAAIGVENGKEVSISNSSFSHQTKFLNIYDCDSLTVEDSDFVDSIVNGSNSQTFVAIRGKSPSNVFTNCVFENNEIYRQSLSSIIRIEGNDNANNVTFDSCTISNNTTQANTGSNQLSYIVYLNTNGRTNIADVTLKDSLITDNKTGGSAVYVTSGGSLTLENSVIKNNTSEMVQEKSTPRGAGINFQGHSLVIGAGSAVYNNTLVTHKTDTLPSHDIYIDTRNSKGTVEVASINDFADFDDPSFDFTEYVWKDAKESGFEEKPDDCSDDAFHYTIVKKSDVMIAQIGDVIYESLEDAFDAAEDGDTIVIVTDAPNLIVNEPIVVDKDITLLIEGHAITLKSSGDNLFTVKDNAKLTLKNDKSKEKNGTSSGIKTGEIAIENGGELIVDDEMILDHISNDGSLKVNDLIKKMDVSLGGDKVVTLGDAYKNASQNDSTLVLTLEDSVVDKLNSGDGSEVKVVSGAGKSFVPATKVNGIASSVNKSYKNNGIVLSAYKAVYLKSSGSDDNSGANADEAVATFSKAKEILKKNPDIKKIIICGTVNISEEEEWSLPKDASVVRDNSFTGVMMQINNGGKLSLEDISITGGADQGIDAQYSIVKVNKGGSLSVHDGTVLSDNYNRNTSASDYRFGGAIYNNGGSVTMDGGNIERCEACFGGGICSYGGTVEMTGGSIVDNRAVNDNSGNISFRAAGGGVMLIGGARFTMGDDSGKTSPTIAHNSSKGEGGGVSVGCLHKIDSWYFSYDEEGNAVKKGTAFIMKSGSIDSNDCLFSGGGIFIQDSMEAYLYGGAITNNRTEAYNTYFGGGGIYVNGIHSIDEGRYVQFSSEYERLKIAEENMEHGYLYLENVEITNNTAHWLGGALGTCNVSKTIIGDMTTAIHDNIIEGKGPTHSIATNDNNVDVYLSLISHFNAGMTDSLGGDPIHPLAYVSNYMIGGGEYDWRHSASGKPAATSDGSRVALYSNEKMIRVFTEKNKDDADMKAAIAGAKLLISGNYSGSNGGGIGSDGIIVFGSILPKVDVSIEKKWDESTDSLARPAKLKFDLYRAEGEDAEAELYKSVEVEPDENGVFTYTWMDLLKCVPNTDTEYVYTVKEDLTYKTVDAEGNPLNLAELYDSSIEYAEDSSREIQRPQTDGTVATQEQTIKNIVITNSLKPDTPDNPEEDEEEESVLPSSESEKEETKVMDSYKDEEPDTVKSEVEADVEMETETKTEDRAEKKEEPKTEAKVKSAKTGDENTLIFFAAMMLMAAAGLFGLRLSRRK